jgi:hypothetical protein
MEQMLNVDVQYYTMLALSRLMLLVDLLATCSSILERSVSNCSATVVQWLLNIITDLQVLLTLDSFKSQVI